MVKHAFTPHRPPGRVPFAVGAALAVTLAALPIMLPLALGMGWLVATLYTLMMLTGLAVGLGTALTAADGAARWRGPGRGDVLALTGLTAQQFTRAVWTETVRARLPWHMLLAVARFGVALVLAQHVALSIGTGDQVCLTLPTPAFVCAAPAQYSFNTQYHAPGPYRMMFAAALLGTLGAVETAGAAAFGLWLGMSGRGSPTVRVLIVGGLAWGLLATMPLVVLARYNLVMFGVNATGLPSEYLPLLRRLSINELRFILWTLLTPFDGGLTLGSAAVRFVDNSRHALRVMEGLAALVAVGGVWIWTRLVLRGAEVAVASKLQLFSAPVTGFKAVFLYGRRSVRTPVTYFIVWGVALYFALVPTHSFATDIRQDVLRNSLVAALLLTAATVLFTLLQVTHSNRDTHDELLLLTPLTGWQRIFARWLYYWREHVAYFVALVPVQFGVGLGLAQLLYTTFQLSEMRWQQLLFASWNYVGHSGVEQTGFAELTPTVAQAVSCAVWLMTVQMMLCGWVVAAAMLGRRYARGAIRWVISGIVAALPATLPLLAWSSLMIMGHQPRWFDFSRFVETYYPSELWIRGYHFMILISSPLWDGGSLLSARFLRMHSVMWDGSDVVDSLAPHLAAAALVIYLALWTTLVLRLVAREPRD